MKNAIKNLIAPFSVAPMLDWTDRHCRYFMRLLSQKAFLYTEMITTGAILYGDTRRALAFNPMEKPLALQLGGSDPQALALCAEIGETYGYDEINLNIGCPSARVQQGRFGACLMKEPQLVAACVSQIKSRVSIPVTVKTRIGVDDQDTYEQLCAFIDTVSQAGCDVFIMHARKAWLKGLSPKENREIPPLRYDIVQKLTLDFPRLHFILNGGIQTLEAAQQHINTFSGVMLGRAISHSPYLLSRVDEMFYQHTAKIRAREEVLAEYTAYAIKQYEIGVSSAILARPLMGLYQGLAGAKQWRRELNTFFKAALSFKT